MRSAKQIRSRPFRRRWRLGFLWVLPFALALGGCSRSIDVSFLDPQGPVAAAQRGHFIAVILLLLIVVVPVLVLTPWFAWRYRYGNASAPYRPHWSFSWPLEIAIWGIPFALVIVLAVWLWQTAVALDPYTSLASAEPPLHVEVIGYDWKWFFIYPDLKIASIGEFAFPADRPFAIDLTSNTVMQSFFIPALGSQIYAMAGMTTHLHLQASSPGSFKGENTQYNGDGFSQQQFVARAMAPGDFAAWTDLVRRKGIPLSATTYTTISRRSTVAQTRKSLNAGDLPNGVLYFTGISLRLFHNVVQSFHGGPSDAASICGPNDQAAKAPSGYRAKHQQTSATAG